ncbi:MAG: NADPH-dependent FMN reductase [Flavobacteriales bacterium]|jgi:NAD(P)H-dependent FMN reductase
MQHDNYLVISGTNRPGSNTRKVAEHYYHELSDIVETAGFLTLEDLPADFAFQDLWIEKSTTVNRMITEQLMPATKYIFVMPEYNGGFPGVLKTFIDCVPPRLFAGKKAGLIGVATGKAGALRPMDQFTNVLNYLKVSVLYAKPKLSEVDKCMTPDGHITDDRTRALLAEHAALMVNF